MLSTQNLGKLCRVWVCETLADEHQGAGTPSACLPVGAESCYDFDPVQMLGACCAQLLQSGERRRSSEEEETVRERGFTSEADKGQEVTMEAELSQDSDSPISSDSLLSLSDLSSLSNASRSSRTDSDSGEGLLPLLLSYLLPPAVTCIARVGSSTW